MALDTDRANGQPALYVYQIAADGTRGAHGIQVLTVWGGRIARIISFNDGSLLTADVRGSSTSPSRHRSP